MTQTAAYPPTAQPLQPLSACQLSRQTCPKSLPKSTDMAGEFDVCFGQARAVSAIKTALAIDLPNYHLFAIGERGLGKYDLINTLLTKHATADRPPHDWAYVYNFDDPRYPIALQLPNGAANMLAWDMEQLWQRIYQQPTAFQAKALQSIKTKSPINPKLQAIFAPLFDKYQDNVRHFLYAAMQDLATYLHSHQNLPIATPARYRIHVLISQPTDKPPIVFENMPTLSRLFGYIATAPQSLSDVERYDVSRIHAGALHRANGGYLILNAADLLNNPTVYQALKHAIHSSTIDILNHSPITGIDSLQPMGIALSVKLIVLGDEDVYDDLLDSQPTLNDVFSIRAYFDHETDRTAKSELMLFNKIAHLVKSYQFSPFDNGACAVIIDELARLCEHQDKLDLHHKRLMQLVIESHLYAQNTKASHVQKHHVKHALSLIKERNSYLWTPYWQDIKSGQTLISTQGVHIGQVNALAVIDHADNQLGLPTRLTALIQPKLGTADIVDIERDVQLGGNVHAKSMMIMTSYLRSLFSEHYPLNFAASLVFEQSYSEVDGDSASLAKMCALLSALSLTPIYQSLAITGSMNQFGQVQAVGGINAKIEGFFDVCVMQGLTGTQGVIIPSANVQNLMLKDDVIQAVKTNQFHIYAVCHVNDALSLLTGCDIDSQKIGKNNKARYAKHTVFGKIVKRLKAWSDNDDK